MTTKTLNVGQDEEPHGRFERNLVADGDVTVTAIEQVLEEVWRGISSEPDERAAAADAGVPEEFLDVLVGEYRECGRSGRERLFTVAREGEGFEPVSAFIVGVAAGLTVHYSKRILDPFWDEYVEPKILAKFSGRLRRK